MVETSHENMGKHKERRERWRVKKKNMCGQSVQKKQSLWTGRADKGVGNARRAVIARWDVHSRKKGLQPGDEVQNEGLEMEVSWRRQAMMMYSDE